MLIALFTIFLLGGGSAPLIDDIQFTENQIELVMEKSDERKSAISTLDEMTKRTKQRGKMLGEMRKRVKKLVADHSTTPEDAERLWSELITETAAFHADMIKLRFELKSHVSRENWEELFRSA